MNPSDLVLNAQPMEARPAQSVPWRDFVFSRRRLITTCKTSEQEPQWRLCQEHSPEETLGICGIGLPPSLPPNKHLCAWPRNKNEQGPSLSLADQQTISTRHTRPALGPREISEVSKSPRKQLTQPEGSRVTLWGRFLQLEEG